ncbi:hypothetical protein [Cryobacterium sp. PH29-G1]|uniref:hypothetical protein n=1 Tax=Cryobacterium sp. PH29-G1 TaxID=3046211 RepID=UPI0024B8CFAB|nr:hypothetical protein [Cryobacterium sp. PH29-G1]MDJ0350248.1 hypothetical protein [Cryobacterium sp. PH29-G1]
MTRDTPVTFLIASPDVQVVARFDVFDSPRGRTVRTSGGTFLRVSGCPLPLAMLQSLAAGADDAALTPAERAAWTTLNVELAARHRSDTAPAWPANRRRILVLCTEPGLDHVAADLVELGADVHTLETSLEPSAVNRDTLLDAIHALAPALVIFLAGDRAPEHLWSGLDTLPSRHIAWLRMHREGTRVWIDPIAVDTTDPHSSHVQHRRLAASPTAVELQAWLTAPAATPLPPLGALAGRTVGLQLIAIARSWAFETTDLEQHRGTAWQYNERTFAASRHPVLSYPQPAPLL